VFDGWSDVGIEAEHAPGAGYIVDERVESGEVSHERKVITCLGLGDFEYSWISTCRSHAPVCGTDNVFHSWHSSRFEVVDHGWVIELPSIGKFET